MRDLTAKRKKMLCYRSIHSLNTQLTASQATGPTRDRRVRTEHRAVLRGRGEAARQVLARLRVREQLSSMLHGSHRMVARSSRRCAGWGGRSTRRVNESSDRHQSSETVFTHTTTVVQFLLQIKDYYQQTTWSSSHTTL